MLPYATAPRKPRELSRGRPEGRTHEIQRLVGRALRSVTDIEKLGERTVWIDCDVLEADGGTRTAAITGAYVAVMLAMRKLQSEGVISEIPLKSCVAAISVGLLEDVPLLDLCYAEDAKAVVDMNVVMTDEGQFVEVQGTGEDAPFTQRQMSAMLKLARKGIAELIAIQKKVLR
jgi:ribonuclease PH